MKEISLKRLSWGPLYPAGDVDFPVCAEREKRLDHNRDIPELCRAVGLQPGDLVLDVGGFVGDTAWAFATHGKARVVMFEPFLDSFVCALYNTLGLPVECVNAAVGNAETVEYIHDCPGPNFGMRRMRECPETTHPEIKTKTVRLDDIIAWERVKLIKIDCEGFEIPAMLGARKLIARDRPILYVEHYVDGQLNCGFTPEQLVDTIKSLGYKMTMWGSAPRWDWYCEPL